MTWIPFLFLRICWHFSFVYYSKNVLRSGGNSACSNLGILWQYSVYLLSESWPLAGRSDILLSFFLRCTSKFWSVVSQHFHLTLHDIPLFSSLHCCENPKLNFLRHPSQLISDLTHYKNHKFGMGNESSVQWKCTKPFCICCVHSSPFSRYLWKKAYDSWIKDSVVFL